MQATRLRCRTTCCQKHIIHLFSIIIISDDSNGNVVRSAAAAKGEQRDVGPHDVTDKAICKHVRYFGKMGHWHRRQR